MQRDEMQKEERMRPDHRSLASMVASLSNEVKSLSKHLSEQNPQGDESVTARNGGADGVRTIDLVGMFFYALERLWLIVLAAIVGTVGASLYASRAVPMYSATAKMYIVSPGDSLINFADLQLGSVLTSDYQEVFQTWEVHEMVRADLGLSYNYDEMQSMIAINNPKDTRLIYITAYSPDPYQAADIANAYMRAAKVFITESMRGEEPLDFSAALVPSMPMSSSSSTKVILGFLLGTALALVFLFVKYIFDDRPQTPDDIMRASGLPTLAILPIVKDAKKQAAAAKVAGVRQEERK